MVESISEFLRNKGFKKKHWLCQSNVGNYLYCFPCLIFNKVIRSNYDFMNIGSLNSMVKE